MGALAGRVVLITGAGRGIGRAEALFFAAEGAKVVVNDPGVEPDGTGGDAAVAAAVADEIVARGGEAVANTDSVSDWDGAQRMVQTAIDTFGDLHVVVNNATIKADRAMTTMTESQFDDVVAVKLKGTFAVSRWAARYWQAQHAAGIRVDRAIVNTSSGSGLVNPLPGQANYAAANAGVAAMTISNALELARHGVRVNCISPSMARTRLTLEVPGVNADPQAIAPVAAYLATEDCPLTGQVLGVSAVPRAQVPAVGTVPSAQVPTVDAAPRGQVPAVDAAPRGQVPAAGALPSAQVPAVSTGPSAQVPVVSAVPRAQAPAVSAAPRAPSELGNERGGHPVPRLHGCTVTINNGWSPGAQVSRDGSPWTVAELGAALGELPFPDQFEKLAAALAGALGAAGREEIQRMIDAQLDK
ncbi:SDR family NAD(P)-dependent oxidoreductase [Kibdelosporangium aridum]|uniref:NAD(P)-dependent dehydrogenase, short-chain alcohol dehydrogenase family n=1 Tax=Kibdelosporangium aridum TaxID=2030 RepID=A0A1W2CV02_KIBAR|nr:SDR family NAD(P)-dependent oxidoreductase [Kibdelosporangium aridum]SMC89065.1 NAD(P)-dependent dehydrogenase, short-chain alcohol dehydrogenase family [Kibdelosporangium aridum]